MEKDTEVLNFGSLNIDHVYKVPHFVMPGETLNSSDYTVFAGGKGLNQSVALARAGVRVAHAGKIGKDGLFLKELLEESGVDTSALYIDDVPTGHAVIQVDEEKGQNSIILYAGANRSISDDEILAVLDQQKPGTWLLLQNEICSIPLIMREARKRGMLIAINPAPCGPEVREFPLELADLLIVNEIEAVQLSGKESTFDEVCSALQEKYPSARIIMTLGKEGAIYADSKERFRVAPLPVKVVDTTSAGDTFSGYFIAATLRGYNAKDAMNIATKASSITVSRAGAAVSIPAAEEIF